MTKKPAITLGKTDHERLVRLADGLLETKP